MTEVIVSPAARASPGAVAPGGALDAILKPRTIAVDFPAVAELDVNPLLAFEHGAVTADGRVRLAAP